MALRFCDSFDHYATADLSGKYSYVDRATITAGVGRTGNAMDLTPFGSGVGRSLDSQSNWIVGLALKISVIPGSELVLIYMTDVALGTQLNLSIGATGQWSVRRNTVVLGTSTAVVPVNTWVYVEFKAVIHPSAGSYDVRVNGASVVSGSGANTAGTGSPNADNIAIFSATGGTQIIDDLYICDATGTTNNNFLGDVTVKAILPDAAGNYAQFTPSAGSNYQNVDDATPDGDSTYNGAADAGKKDSYNFGAVGLTGPVLGVQTVLTARKDIGGSKIVKDLVRISGTDYNGSNASLTDAYKMHRQIHELNPATSANWTIAAIDAAEFGVEVVS